GVDRRGNNGFKSEGEQSIASENGCRLAKFLVVGGFAAAEIIVIERGQIVVNQRVSVDELYGAGGIVSRCNIRIEDAGGLEAQNRADALSACKDAISHGLVNRGWRGGFHGHQAVEGGIDLDAVFFKKEGELHFHGKVARTARRGEITIRSRLRDRRARR